ncbi:MAG TPA: Uma2 family endonuclease [Xenococcaceae cyanobacterium]
MKAIKSITVAEFLKLPEVERPLELVDGQAIPKMAPKFFHSRLQKTLLFILDAWAKGRGRVEPEWAIKLKRNNVDWIPVPDLTYISYERLKADWMLNEPCPIAPELVIEIISPGQLFSNLTEKATDYLRAGVDRVWLIDTPAKTITIFYPSDLPQIMRGEIAISDELFPELELSSQKIFQQAGLL